MESPGLVFPTAPIDVMSNGADNLLPLFDDELPKDFMDWCESRVDVHWPKIRDEMHEEWSKDARKAGNWHEYSMEVYRDMCVTALRMHMDEVNQCRDTIEESELSDWRNGIRNEIPAPDGRENSGPHPLAQTGECTLVEAWEIARPWFVDPDAEPFSLNVVHPEHWFQGEYDLVYRHGGKIRIMDLKASRGGGDRSGNYVEQLRMYAMLWWITHGKEEQVDNLEIWYLGADSIKQIPVPSEEEMNTMEASLNNLWKQLKAEVPSMDECPPKPSPMRGFSPGGVPTEAPGTLRCDSCDWKAICPGGKGPEELPNGGRVQLPGSTTSFDLTPMNALEPRMTLIAEVFSILGGGEGKRPKIKIVQDGRFADIQLLVDTHQDGEPAWPPSLAKGDRVKLDGVVPSANYKGELQLKVDPHAIIVHASKGEHIDTTLLDFRARWNVTGNLVYRFEKKGIGRNGKSWHRKGMMLLDETGSMKIEGWAADWGPQYDLAEIGDTLVAANISLDAWAIDVKGQINRNSKIQITHRVDRGD